MFRRWCGEPNKNARRVAKIPLRFCNFHPPPRCYYDCNTMLPQLQQEPTTYIQEYRRLLLRIGKIPLRVVTTLRRWQDDVIANSEDCAGDDGEVRYFYILSKVCCFFCSFLAWCDFIIRDKMSGFILCQGTLLFYLLKKPQQILLICFTTKLCQHWSLVPRLWSCY